MTFDMGAMIARAMREEGKELLVRMERLLSQPSVSKVFPLPAGEVEVVLDPTMPPGEIRFQQYDVTVGLIVNLAED